MRILLADDHAVVRRGLRQLLIEAFAHAECTEAETAAQVLDFARARQWDLVILDLHMPGRSGLELLRELKREHPRLPVLILSMYPEDQFAVRAFKAGAAGYLTKESAPEELVNAIKKIVKGRKHVSPSVAERLAEALTTKGDHLPHEKLSDREYGVMCSLAQGKTVSEIARELTLSVKTVSTYRTRVLKKIAAKNDAELTAYAFRRHLVE